jgi:hypothetical protein
VQPLDFVVVKHEATRGEVASIITRRAGFRDPEHVGGLPAPIPVGSSADRGRHILNEAREVLVGAEVADLRGEGHAPMVLLARLVAREVRSTASGAGPSALWGQSRKATKLRTLTDQIVQ